MKNYQETIDSFGVCEFDCPRYCIYYQNNMSKRFNVRSWFWVFSKIDTFHNKHWLQAKTLQPFFIFRPKKGPSTCFIPRFVWGLCQKSTLIVRFLNEFLILDAFEEMSLSTWLSIQMSSPSFWTLGAYCNKSFCRKILLTWITCNCAVAVCWYVQKTIRTCVSISIRKNVRTVQSTSETSLQLGQRNEHDWESKTKSN